MRKRIVCIVTICVILACMVLGIVKRGSYTNITAEENYMNKLQVALLPEQIAITACEELQEILPSAPIVMQVETVGELENVFYTSRQRVKIEKIYSGKNIKEEEIYVYSNHWKISLSAEPKSMERGFVNVMEVGKKYLIFLSGETENLYGGIPVYQLYDDAMIAPVFCCEKTENQVVQTNGEHTYVPYSKVRGNEFFGESENAIRAWEKLKENMLAERGIEE